MEQTSAQGGAYGVQVLIAGQQKHWRDEVASQIRRAGYATTTVDCGLDAMTVLALGLPVDVLVTDRGLKGELCCDKLASEALALRPDLRIVFASDLSKSSLLRNLERPDGVDGPGGDRFMVLDARPDAVAVTVREALGCRN